MHAASARVCTQDTQTSFVSVRVVRGLAEAVEYAGGSRSAFLSTAGLDSTQLDSAETRVKRAELYRLFEAAVTLSHDPALGLHWCEGLQDSVFNPITQLIRHAPTLRSGLETMTRFRSLLSDPPSYELVEADNKVTFRCVDMSSEPAAVQRFVGEMLVIGFIRLLRVFSPHVQTNWLGFAYPAPSYAAEYTRLLGQPVQFEQPFTGVVFDATLLSLPSPYKDEELHQALRRIAEQRILQVTRNVPTSARVRAYLVAQGAKPQIDMPEVARALGMSARSLRRRLNEEGVSFNDLARDACASVAKQLLRNKHWSIQEAAYEMGFAHSTTFHRAFKRWTGTTPKEFRQQRG